ncbi:YncE family protein [Novosphingobium sp.]|uniref:YncE family protein n=1 Tax=Novosphingobium sp. TaxID=1874826 RepID=UPI003D14B673
MLPRSRMFKSFRTFTALVAGPLALAAAGVTPAHAGTLMLGTYPDKLFTIDDVTGAVKDKIKLDAGLPVSLRLSDDRKKIFATTITTSGMVVLDADTHKILTEFSLNTPTERYRFQGGVPDPTGRYFYTVMQRFDKLSDRYTVSKLQYVVVDLAQKKIVRAVDMEAADDALPGGYRASLMISPDGKTLYMFKGKVLVIDVASLKVVDRIDLQKADAANYEDVQLGGGVEGLQLTHPNELVSLFTAADPFVHNKIFGLGRFDLTARKFTFTPIGPITNQISGLEVTPDGKYAYTTATNGATGNKRCEFWKFDLASLKLADKVEFKCRSRYTLGMSADGAKIYIYGASYDIEVYDAATLKYEKTWDLGADATMAGMVALR